MREEAEINKKKTIVATALAQLLGSAITPPGQILALGFETIGFGLMFHFSFFSSTLWLAIMGVNFNSDFSHWCWD